MPSTTVPALFQPIQVGDIKLSHRVVLAPLTRLRADSAHVPTDMVQEYYVQRARVPGTLLISEATFIAPEAGGMPHAPGIWNFEQIAAWKKITEAVHAKGSYIYLQLWALGRAARTAALKQENPDFNRVAPSPIALSISPEDIPHELTKDEIKQYVRWYGTAAHNAVNLAGFDGVEIHGANGYLVDQFNQDVSNKRTDEYGGSIENRARFALEILDAVTTAVGQNKTAIRLSPWSKYQDMGMEDPLPTFTYLLEQMKEKYPNLAYLHSVDAKAFGNEVPKDPSLSDFMYRLWAPRTIISTGGYDRDSAIKIAEETGQIIGFGQLFISNPDLPFRLRENIPLTAPEVDTFYVPMTENGYTTYPFSEEFFKSESQL
ncbi:NADH:flavin oxidoreductase/NADH oxidase [Earliella scabrosa]|nr:NADH:flavin oxidoreductase/NADH oxidase [Earliella scabrosa]